MIWNCQGAKKYLPVHAAHFAVLAVLIVRDVFLPVEQVKCLKRANKRLQNRVTGIKSGVCQKGQSVPSLYFCCPQALKRPSMVSIVLFTFSMFGSLSNSRTSCTRPHLISFSQCFLAWERRSKPLMGVPSSLQAQYLALPGMPRLILIIVGFLSSMCSASFCRNIWAGSGPVSSVFQLKNCPSKGRNGLFVVFFFGPLQQIVQRFYSFFLYGVPFSPFPWGQGYKGHRQESNPAQWLQRA